jgi:hypothetical protein
MVMETLDACKPARIEYERGKRIDCRESEWKSIDRWKAGLVFDLCL